MIKLSALLILGLTLVSCTHFKSPDYKTALDYSKSKEFKPGKLVIIQGPTSDTETNINVLSPRLKNYKYEVSDETGSLYSVDKYETVYTEPLHWKIDKLHVKGLQPEKKYTLKVNDEFRSSVTVVDTRTFKTLNIKKTEIRFAYASCMADDYRFNEVIDPMWERMRKLNPELIVLNGDIVYVDSFEFVERQKATELDIWFRFIDSLSRLPVYRWTELKPILTTWDDHDFGTNDGDRDFVGKEAARKIFLGFFGGKNIEGVYNLQKDSVYSSFEAFGQKMFFMDNRYFRQPNKDQKTAEKYAHWGENQHHWLLSKLNDSPKPSWIFNGNQVFSGTDLSFKESMQSNNPEHFKTLLEDLKNIDTPVLFASGDIHFSEIMNIPTDKIGYPTYEVTSSSMHSYTGTGWDNPLRMDGAFTKEFNFLMIKSMSSANKFKIEVESWGLPATPYFSKSFEVSKPVSR